MSEKRKSVMILPKSGNKILLQRFTNSDGEVTWDGFGSFYPIEGDSIFTAETVLLNYFKTASLSVHLEEWAKLNYLIDKPGGIVDLDVTVYFVKTDSSFSVPDQAKWFNHEDIPYAKMHQATEKWLPLLLKDKKHLDAQIKVRQPADHTTGIVTEFTIL